MSVFEDLIEELKEENLLEETVIETGPRNRPVDSFESSLRPPIESIGGFPSFASPAREAASEPFVRPVREREFPTNNGMAPAVPDAFEPMAVAEVQNAAADDIGLSRFADSDDVANSKPEIHSPFQSAAGADPGLAVLPSVPPLPEPATASIIDTEVVPKFQDLGAPETIKPNGAFQAPAAEPADFASESNQVNPELNVRPPVNPAAFPINLEPPVGRTSFATAPRSSFGAAGTRAIVNHKEYFKKRAIDEVTGLQMVDHVLSGVEREQMKLVPKSFDDIPVKKALHDFMQVSGDTKSADHARAEFQLMQETESWYSSLSHRDRHISVAHLRRYCETTKPALSPQALIALGRFYRNSPFSEQVRNKFDLVMTRLYSVEKEEETRELLFPRDELIAQIKDLYAEWSSIQVYTSSEDDSEILIAVLKFQDFVTEAEATKTFDELIGNDFFNRLRLFKESCHENFFAPLITVASIEANVKIGNRYIELIKKERAGANAAALEEKYGFLHDQAISDSTGKTFYLIELLKDRVQETKTNELVEVRVNQDQQPIRRKPVKERSSLWGVNKWLLGFTILVFIVCGGLYGWAEFKSQELSGTISPKVKKVNLDNSSLKEYLQSARINEETFYGVTHNSWTDLSLEKKEEMLKRIMSIGNEKGFKRVHLLNEKGRAVGYASSEKVEVYNP